MCFPSIAWIPKCRSRLHLQIQLTNRECTVGCLSKRRKQTEARPNHEWTCDDVNRSICTERRSAFVAFGRPIRNLPLWSQHTLVTGVTTKVRTLPNLYRPQPRALNGYRGAMGTTLAVWFVAQTSKWLSKSKIGDQIQALCSFVIGWRRARTRPRCGET